jgi:hypothetical protein
MKKISKDNNNLKESESGMKTRRSLRLRNSTEVVCKGNNINETEKTHFKLNRNTKKESPPKEIKQNSVKAKKIEAPKQISRVEGEQKLKKVSENDIFNHDFDDLKILKKKEIREKLEFEVKNF